jgi:hypothetical protein
MTYPTPNPNPLRIDVIFRRPDTNKGGANYEERKEKKTRALDNSPRSVDLVPHLPEPKVSLDRVPQRPAFTARSASIDDYNDVL